MSTSLTTTISGRGQSKTPVVRSERGSTVDYYKWKESTTEEGSTTTSSKKTTEDRLEEEYRGNSKKSTEGSRLPRIDSKKTTEETRRRVPRKSTRRRVARKSTTEATGVEGEERTLQEHNERTTDTEYRGEPTFRLLDRRVLSTIARGVSGATTRRTTARTGSQEDQKAT